MSTSAAPKAGAEGAECPADSEEARKAAIRAMVDGWPPLTEEQRQRLALLLRPQAGQ